MDELTINGPRRLSNRAQDKQRADQLVRPSVTPPQNDGIYFFFTGAFAGAFAGALAGAFGFERSATFFSNWLTFCCRSALALPNSSAFAARPPFSWVKESTCCLRLAFSSLSFFDSHPVIGSNANAATTNNTTSFFIDSPPFTSVINHRHPDRDADPRVKPAYRYTRGLKKSSVRRTFFARGRAP